MECRYEQHGGGKLGRNCHGLLRAYRRSRLSGELYKVEQRSKWTFESEARRESLW